MFWLLYFLEIGLCTCSASSIADKKETDTHGEMGTDCYGLVIRLTSKMESLSEKLNFVDKQLQVEAGRSRSSDIDLAVLKTREKCIQDEIKELKAAYGRTTDDRKEITKLRESVTKLPSVVDKLSLQRDNGNTFIRWGRTTCPVGNNVVYKGFAAGNKHDSETGTADMLCFSEDPIYANHSQKLGDKYRSPLYGTEYETDGCPAFGAAHNSDMPCTVCFSQSKHSSVMVSGRNKCFPGLNMEHWGYLMGPLSDHALTQSNCVDTDVESIAGGGADLNGNVLYLVEPICGSLQCPPYKNGWELSCAACAR